MTTPGSGSRGQLASQLDALRRRHVGVLALTGLAILLVVSAELLALALFADWWIELPWAVRLGSLIAQAALATYVLLTMVIAPLIRQPNEDELALMVERARPETASGIERPRPMTDSRVSALSWEKNGLTLIAGRRSFCARLTAKPCCSNSARF